MFFSENSILSYFILFFGNRGLMVVFRHLSKGAVKGGARMEQCTADSTYITQSVVPSAQSHS